MTGRGLSSALRVITRIDPRVGALIPARKQKPPVRPRPEQKFVEVAKPEAGLRSLRESSLRLGKGRSLPEVVDKRRALASGAERAESARRATSNRSASSVLHRKPVQAVSLARLRPFSATIVPS